ncbi:MAG: transcriptional regulator, partial [Methylocystis sp.]
WAARSPLHDPTLPLSAASLMLSFKTMFDASRAKGLNARIGFRIGDETFLVHIHGGACDAARQALDGAEVVFAGQARAIAGAVYGGAPLEALEAEKALWVEGDRALAERFTSLFPLPQKA